ncbi:putative mfs multidrug protein [Eutypa lata UCREL1]|uniref:Putative mfs multidrug protein n=1 Tax=Eutypa lata (strain UCR-EL1) TaxID=1287681 RepID=M7TQR7_EUTLA|nr:putative mfs multidrug protein [Eutypa lata UCREL1]
MKGQEIVAMAYPGPSSSESSQISSAEEKLPSSVDSGPTVVQFIQGDPENPYNWALGKKLYIVFTAILLTVNSTISSAITSNAVSYIKDDFGITGDIQDFLPTTVYLIGYIFGPLVFSPLSESIGRKPVTFWTFNVFILFTLASALAPNWPSLLIFRLICETYGPTILKKRAQKLRKSTGNLNIVAPVEIEAKSYREFIIASLARPLRIKGQAGIALAPIGIGAAFSGPVLLYYDNFFERAKRRGAAWVGSEEYHRLPVAILGGPFVVISFFWLAWTARPTIHWIVPCLPGLLFGFGYLLIFTALTNYQVDAYDIYAASAMAASCFSRSVVGATLPLAAKPLRDSLDKTIRGQSKVNNKPQERVWEFELSNRL